MNFAHPLASEFWYNTPCSVEGGVDCLGEAAAGEEAGGYGNSSEVMSEPQNQIVVYQPDKTVRLEVRLENETVWLTQSQMATLFGCSTDNVGLHLKNIYACGELDRNSTAEESSVVQVEGRRKVSRRVSFYNLDAIISVGYRVNSVCKRKSLRCRRSFIRTSSGTRSRS